jgi:hypothetical protein
LAGLLPMLDSFQYTGHTLMPRFRKWNGPLQDSGARTVLVAFLVWEYWAYGIQNTSADYERTNSRTCWTG